MRGLKEISKEEARYLEADILNALAYLHVTQRLDGDEDYGTAYDKLYEFYTAIKDSAEIFFSNHDIISENKYYREKYDEILQELIRI